VDTWDGEEVQLLDILHHGLGFPRLGDEGPHEPSCWEPNGSHSDADHPFHLHHFLGGFIVVGGFWWAVFGFLIVGGLYSVTAMRENDNERATVYTKHRQTLQALVTEA
jgi:hypothetical protein